MRVAITYKVDVDDEYRRAINQFYGKPGLATREEVKDWFRAYGESMDDDLAITEDAPDLLPDTVAI